MFMAGGSHIRLSFCKGADLWIDIVCTLASLFMPWKYGYGPGSQHIEGECRNNRFIAL